MSLTIKAATAMHFAGAAYAAGDTIDTTGMNDRSIAVLLKHQPVYVSAASSALVFAYTATASPVPTSGGDGLTLVGTGGAAVSTPTETEWDNTLGQGTTKPCASLAAGVYLVTMSWTVAGADVAGAYAYVAPVDATEVPIPGNGLLISSPGTVQSVVVAADVPIRLGAAAGATNADVTRTFDMHLWATKIADFG